MWDVYIAVRNEILLNQALMHWSSIVAVIVLLAGVVLCETRTTILSALLPLLGVGWAAEVARFDFLIHRQGAYLRTLEAALTEQGGPVLWETWKSHLRAQRTMLPILDAIMALPIIAATLFIAFRPALNYLLTNHIPGARAYPWAITMLQLAILMLLAFIPNIAGR